MCLALGVLAGAPAAAAVARGEAAAGAAEGSGPAVVERVAAEPVAAEPAAAGPAAAGLADAKSRVGPEVDPFERLARAFEARDPEEPLDDRVARVRAEASRMGMWSAEPAARGLLLANRLGKDADRARAAVRLAPGLPAAWGALAVSAPGAGSGPALLRGLVEMERNLDASVWWRATAWHALAWGLLVGGILFLVGSAARLAPSAAHDLSHRLPGRLPPHALAAVLASLGILPAALGEGLVGLAAGAFAVAFPWAAPRHRAVLLASLAAVMAAVHPVTGETGRWIAALRADPATAAIRNAEVGGLAPAQRERLARLAPRDPAASHALAIWSKRSDRLDEAQGWLDLAEARESDHPVLLNDAANVRLALGDSGGAIRLYEDSVLLDPNAVVYFNLAQVYGSRIELERQESALEAAHAASAATVRELSELRGNGRLAVDLPWPAAELRARLASAADGRDVAAELRVAFGSGRLVNDPFVAPGLLLAVVLVGLGVGRGRSESRVCGACHARRCPSCVPRRADGCSVCGAPGSAPPLLDAVVGLGKPVAVRVFPGLAGVTADEPFLGWTAAVAAATACAAFVLRDGVVPDPLVAGHIGQAAFLLAAAVLGAVAVVTTWWPLRSLR